MTAAEWKSRITAVVRADAQGDPAPLNIVCGMLADQDAQIADLGSQITLLEELATRPATGSDEVPVDPAVDGGEATDGDETPDTDPTVSDA